MSTKIERDEYLRVITITAAQAKAFFGRTDEPVDLGRPTVRTERYAPNARVWGFRVAAPVLGSRSVPQAKCPTCHGPAEMIDRAPDGESGDVVRCDVCDTVKP